VTGEARMVQVRYLFYGIVTDTGHTTEATACQLNYLSVAFEIPLQGRMASWEMKDRHRLAA
jgi:nanoRNase/pAp phosphatase (c-di-AMP/oligoRNAs hydrolase)